MSARIGVIAIFLLVGCAPSGPDREASADHDDNRLNPYFGDLHNHNSIGQIRGSLERTFEIAPSHLDFFAFTPQSQWPDMREIPQGRNAQFESGFQAVRENWAKIQRLTAEVNEPGAFAAFLGYEVHYNDGDFNIIYPGADAELVYLETIEEWQQHARETAAILIPHHPGYRPFWRGWDWSRLDPEVSPVVEMMSEHGNAESDRSPIRYIRHSMGGRYTKSTVQWLWKTGVRAGVIASPDDHLGYPGAYGQGLAAVWADELTRGSIMEAIKARRTYAVNADRIELDFKLNGRWMGESVPAQSRRNIAVNIRGEDVIDRVEVLRNNRVIHRVHPVDREPTEASWDEPVLVRVEYGWGPWADFNMPRTADWRFRIELKGGELLSVSPHFQSRPFDEDRRDKVLGVKEHSFEMVSYTSREKAYEDKPTKDVVLEIAGSPETEVALELTAPARMTFTKTLGELAESNEVLFLGEFSTESMLFHRVVFADNYRAEFKYSDEESTSAGWYQVRVAQTNGSYAWSSPIWVEERSYSPAY
ncbi:MAG: DUF3604 domain-containing protein [Bryobacterales bacterium]|nr:DUF3604 domain-containing protein [Bryobacterales bacterium]